MEDIDAILELARTVEPADKSNPTFILRSDAKGQWHAKFTMAKYYVLAENASSPEAALADLRKQCVGLNNGILRRIKDTLARWTGTKSTLRVVKGGGQ